MKKYRFNYWLCLVFTLPLGCSEPEGKPGSIKALCKGDNCQQTGDTLAPGGSGDTSDATPGAMPGTMPPIPSDSPFTMEKPVDTVEPIETETDQPTTQEKKLWRLSPKQLSNTYSAALGTQVSIESRFELGSRPNSGFGLDSNQLALDSIYAPTLGLVANDLVQNSLADIKKKYFCLNTAAPDQVCLQTVVKQLGLALFRRPIADEETLQYSSLYQSIRSDSSSDEAVKVMLEAMMRSPFAQFRFELGAAVAGSPGVFQLMPFELASQISFALTDSPPDAELLAAAQKGDLIQKDVLEKHIARLMKSEKFEAGFAEFITLWTGTKWLPTISKSKPRYPQYGVEVVKSMLEEERQFAVDFLRREGTFKDLLTQTETTITPPLATIYGLPAFQGAKKINSPKERRSGIFTLPGVIAAHSSSSETGPVGRGVFLMEKLLCYTPPPPPPDIVTVVPKIDPNLTFRERFAAHVANPTCASCHVTLDPLGFSMERYDAIGQFRSTDAGKPIDSSGEIKLSGTSFSFDDAPQMLNLLADSKDIQQCFVKQVMHYAFGRPMGRADEKFVKSTQEQFVSSGLNVKKLLVSIYTSNNFRYRKEK